MKQPIERVKASQGVDATDVVTPFGVLRQVVRRQRDTDQIDLFIVQNVLNQAALASDHSGAPVFLARNAWHLERAAKDHPKLRFLSTKEELY